MARSLLVFLLLLFLVRAIWRLLEGVVRGAVGEGPPRPPGPRQAPAAVKLAKDPVCGTFVVPGKVPSLVRAGETLYFCSNKCRDTYAAR